MSIEENKKAVLRFVDDISKGEYDKVLNALTDDATWWVAGNLPDSGLYEREKLNELIGGLDSFFPNGVTITVDHLIGEGDFVAVEGRSRAELTKDKSYENKYHWCFEVREGKIRAVREYTDTLYAKEILYG